jgi:transcription elongation GreA/GreB family factor
LIAAPVGRALAGHRRGDSVEVVTLRGRPRMQILDVSPRVRPKGKAA